jgi:hypothetical protein
LHDKGNREDHENRNGRDFYDEQPFEREKFHPKEHSMYFKTSTLAAAIIAVSAFAAHAQSSSTPSMAPTTGGAS